MAIYSAVPAPGRLRRWVNGGLWEVGLPGHMHWTRPRSSPMQWVTLVRRNSTYAIWLDPLVAFPCLKRAVRETVFRHSSKLLRAVVASMSSASATFWRLPEMVMYVAEHVSTIHLVFWLTNLRYQLFADPKPQRSRDTASHQPDIQPSHCAYSSPGPRECQRLVDHILGG